MNRKRLLLDLVSPWRTEEHKVVTFRGTDRQVMGSCDRLIRPRGGGGGGGGGGGRVPKSVVYQNFTP